MLISVYKLTRVGFNLSTCTLASDNKTYYHSLYSILDFDWLIYLQITVCKYRSAANNWCKYVSEHAHFENASSAPNKNIVLS